MRRRIPIQEDSYTTLGMSPEFVMKEEVVCVPSRSRRSAEEKNAGSRPLRHRLAYN
jgi:hypothetical protein